MKKTTVRSFVLVAALALLASSYAFAGAQQEAKKAAAGEHYYWIASLSTLPLFLFHDYPTLKLEAESWGASISFAGPTNIDINAENNILAQVVGQKPAGVLFMPFGAGSDTAINDAIKQGVPVVTIDGDAPNSNRLCYSGTDWVELGRIQARTMAHLLGGKGQVMLSAVIPNDNTRKARSGIEAEMANYPGIKIVGLQNDKGSVTDAARLTAEAIQSNPNISGFIGIDASSGPGIATALKEAGMTGKVKVVSVDDTPDIVQAVKDGGISASIVQKREAFEVWGFRVLYAYNHPATPIMAKYKAAGFPMIPKQILTGVMVLTKDNVAQVQGILDYQQQIYDQMKNQKK